MLAGLASVEEGAGILVLPRVQHVVAAGYNQNKENFRTRTKPQDPSIEKSNLEIKTGMLKNRGFYHSLQNLRALMVVSSPLFSHLRLRDCLPLSPSRLLPPAPFHSVFLTGGPKTTPHVSKEIVLFPWPI